MMLLNRKSHQEMHLCVWQGSHIQGKEDDSCQVLPMGN